MTNRRRIRTGACDLKRKSGLIFGAALVSVALAACGGSDGDSPAAVVAPPSPPPSAVANDNTLSPPVSVPTENVPPVASDDAAARDGDAVVASVPGTTTLSWTPPTLTEDGAPLQLKGYRIYWGQQKGYYTSSVTLDNPGLTRYVVEQLPAATWYFVATALSERGESEFSNEIAMRVL